MAFLSRQPRLVTAVPNPPEPADVGVTDILVFARSGSRFQLIGGAGRGVGWAGVVEVPVQDEPLLAAAWDSGVIARADTPEKARKVGPYWNRHAAAVPVGQEHVVVFGSATPIEALDAALVRAAAQAVAATGVITPDKLMGDELELVHAVRAVMEHRPESLEETAEHIATVAARALSCEVGAVAVMRDDDVVIATYHQPDLDEATRCSADCIQRALPALLKAPLLEQVPPLSDEALGTGIVARMVVPIGRPVIGVLLLGHAASAPRGFTGLCQRIGRALAEAAELMLSQASAREALRSELDLLTRVARTDSLTGLLNRAGWEERLEADAARARRHGGTSAIVSMDLDNLKGVNDRFGHATGDQLIRDVGHLLRRETREYDAVARLGGDEFLVLLVGADANAARG